MKRIIPVALLALVFLVVTLAPAFAACPCGCGSAKAPGKCSCGSGCKALKSGKVKVVSAVCPVMGKKIADVTKATGGKSVYKGKTYYFCCKGCKSLFDKNPEKYIQKASAGKGVTKPKIKSN